MILILLFMPDFWFGLVNLKNAKHLKRKNVLISANTTHTSEISRPISIYWEY